MFKLRSSRIMAAIVSREAGRRDTDVRYAGTIFGEVKTVGVI